MNLTKQKRIIISVATILLLVVCGFGAYNYKMHKDLNNTKFSKAINNDKCKILNSNFENGKGRVTLEGKLSKEELKELVLKTEDLAKSEKWSEKVIEIDVVSNNSDISTFDKFYTNNLVNRIYIDLEKKDAKIGEFVKVDNIEKTNELPKIEKEKIEKENGVIKIYFSMEDMKDPKKDISRAHMFEDLFKNSNKDKDIKDLELIINSKENKSYIYNSKFGNVIEVVEKVKL